MANLPNGTYIVVSAKDPTMAIDVNQNSDAKKANIQVWKRNMKSGQYVSVTGTYPKQVLRFPLTGKVLDVYDATAKNGQNIIQWVANDGNGQAWKIDETGSSITINQTSYPTYYIRTALSSNLLVATKGSATANGTNVQLMTYSSSNTAQRWAFIPVALLPKGYYRFVSAADDNVSLSVANTKDGGNVQAAGTNIEDNKQVWEVTGSTSVTYLTNFGSKCYMNAAGTANGSNVNQKAKGGFNTGWLLRQNGQLSFRHSVYSTIMLLSRAGDGQGSENAVDVADSSGKLQTNAVLRARNLSSLSQRFIAVPTVPLSSSIPAPSDVLMAYSKGGAAYKNIWGRGRVTAYPCWISNYTNFQIRYRQRVRKHNFKDDERSAWSAWHFYGNDISNDGWGDVTQPNAKPALMKDPNGQSRRYNIAHTYTLSPTGNDLVEYEFQVRAFSVTSKRRGALATLRGRFVYRPECTVSNISWNPTGLAIRYSSDQKRNNNDLVVYSVTCVHNGRTYTIYDGGTKGYPINDIPWSGVAVLPQSQIKYVPAENDNITVKFRFTNVDGAYNSSKQTATLPCSYGTGKGMTITPTEEITDGMLLHIRSNVANATKHSLWIDYEDNRSGFIRYNDTDGEWHLPVLLNRPFRAWLMVEQGSKWDVWTKLYSAIESDAYVFNFENASTGAQDWLRVEINADEPPAFQRSVSYDNEAFMTNGNALEVVHFGNARQESVSVGGIFPFSFTMPNSTVAKLEALGQAHYAWLRAPKVSTAWRVAIESFNLDYSNPDYIKVDISVRRIGNPADW